MPKEKSPTACLIRLPDEVAWTGEHSAGEPPPSWLLAILTACAGARWQARDVVSPEHWRRELSGSPDANLAAMRAGKPLGDGVWLCCDPVHVTLGRDDVFINPQHTLDLSAEEAGAFIATLNAHFAQDGIEFVVATSNEWCVKMPTGIGSSDIATLSLAQVLARPLSQCAPKGSAAMRLKSIETECQMLLYNHPVNEARAARRALPVNGLWCWGEGGEAALASASSVAGFDCSRLVAEAQITAVLQAARAAWAGGARVSFVSATRAITVQRTWVTNLWARLRGAADETGFLRQLRMPSVTQHERQ